MAGCRSLPVVLNPKSNTPTTVRVSLLANDAGDCSPLPLLDLRESPSSESDLEPIQLLEAHEYLFEITSPLAKVETDSPELFEPDDSSGKRGRVKTGLFTGIASVIFFSGNESLGTVRFEIRSRKLDYISQYRWMLRDLADEFGELTLQGFAAAQQRLEVDSEKSSELLYQRFAFLSSTLFQEEFQSSIARIIQQPHSEGAETDELRSPSRGIPGGSRLNRELGKPGPRIPWLNNNRLSSIPVSMMLPRHHETTDCYPNRFVKFALSKWRSEVAHLRDILLSRKETGSILRGRAEAQKILRHLDILLAKDVFRGIGPLTRMEANNQVLLRKEGYRTSYRAFLQSDLASRLTWKGGDSVYGAGQRNVAVLYEYWSLVQLSRVLSQVTGTTLDLRTLISESDDGLTLTLQRGKEACLRASCARFGRALELELWFNKTFSKGADSWSAQMRPDYSIRIRQAGVPSSAKSGDVWLHFDAKYRVEKVESIIATEDEETGGKDGLAKRTDMLIMHAYRDAIRRSVGAYVLYPGSEKNIREEFHEVVPGIGAFPLKPTQGGEPDGAHALVRFVNEVVDHVASQMTQRERARYWEEDSFLKKREGTYPANTISELDRPPADTLVLLGYVKERSHYAWIRESGYYNLRAGNRRGSVGLDGREISADFVLLYGESLEPAELRRVSGPPVVMTKEIIQRHGYADPKGDYLCLPTMPVTTKTWTDVISLREIEGLTCAPSRIARAPLVLSLLDLYEASLGKRRPPQ